VQAHGHELVLAVSADFAAQLAAGRPAPILLYADSSDPSAAASLSRVTALLGQYGSRLARLRMVARGVDPRVLSRSRCTTSTSRPRRAVRCWRSGP